MGSSSAAGLGIELLFFVCCIYLFIYFSRGGGRLVSWLGRVWLLVCFGDVVFLRRTLPPDAPHDFHLPRAFLFLQVYFLCLVVVSSSSRFGFND